MKCLRGITIGGCASQLIGNLSVNHIDHRMKEVPTKCKCYVRYCDDTTGLARTKAEAWAMLNNYIRMSDALGLAVKHSFVVAPIGSNKRDGHGKKKRKRQRSKTRKEH